jgi:outer membrane protein OmpA-like peptidoglycan-associated protein
MRFGTAPALLALASLLAWPADAALADTAPADEPQRFQIRHFPGSKVVKRSLRDFDEYWLPLGKLRGDGQADDARVVEGRWTHVTLANPEGRSVAEVYKHYEQRLAEAGFEVLFSCKDVECGEGGRRTNGDWWPLTESRRYVAARLERPAEGDVFVSVHVHARRPGVAGAHEVDVVEMRPPAVPPAPRNEADVATLEKELRQNGRVVLRSLGFIDGRAMVLPESEPIVQAIGLLLAKDPALRLHVVVHGDDASAPDGGVDLTRKRAAAVVALLTRRHRVPAARVRPAGAGALAPIASNATEEGRAENRRVELVPR